MTNSKEIKDDDLLRDKLNQLYEDGLLSEKVDERIERIKEIELSVEGCKDDLELNEFEQLFKALASKTRLMILKLLFQGIKCSCEIEHILGLSQSTVSHHLKLLADAKVVETQKTGKWNIMNIEGTKLSKEFFIRLIIDV
jgi:ArsR family transcriptional regulator